FLGEAGDFRIIGTGHQAAHVRYQARHAAIERTQCEGAGDWTVYGLAHRSIERAQPLYAQEHSYARQGDDSGKDRRKLGLDGKSHDADLSSDAAADGLLPSGIWKICSMLGMMMKPPLRLPIPLMNSGRQRMPTLGASSMEAASMLV